MSEHIPAWKRIGLNVKKELQVDPLAITTTVDPTKLSTKQLKKLKRTRDEVDDQSNVTKKEPKRAKLPKDKKPPPPEKDQLVYLRQFTEDKENWKFAKSKQNWILKNLFKIESKYDSYLQNYVKDLQGGSKDRLVNELKDVIVEWNKINEDLEAKLAKDLEGDDEDAEAKAEEATKKEKKDDKEEEAPEYDNVIKARDLIQAMTGEQVEVKGIDSLEPVNAESVTKDESESSEKEEEKQSENDDNDLAEEDNSQGNLIVEEVEVTDFVSREDYKDPQVSETEAEEGQDQAEDLSIKEKVPKSEKKEKKKKEKKDKKKKKKESKEKKEKS